MLLEDAAAGVLDRHLPAAEVGHLGPERDVPVVEGAGAKVAHAQDPSDSSAPARDATFIVKSDCGGGKFSEDL